MPVQIGSKASDLSDPTGLMSDCHRRIEMFLNTLRAAGDLNGRQLAEDERRALDAALRYFREAAPKHNADEEESLFPRLRSIPDPEVWLALADVARLEQDHRWAAPSPLFGTKSRGRPGNGETPQSEQLCIVRASAVGCCGRSRTRSPS